MEKLPWRKRQQPEPFLAPLTPEGRARKRTQIFIDDLPPAAAPLAVTILGAVALFFLFGALSNGSDVAGEAAAPEGSIEPPPATATILPDAPAVAPAEPIKAAEPARASPPVETAAQLIQSAKPLQLADPAQTNSILQAMPHESTFVPPVPVAETEDDIERLEEMQLQQNEGAREQRQPSGNAPADTDPLRTAVASASVNMRAGPSDEAEVLAIVPANAEIKAEPDCKSWCAVSYEGKTGYIYKNFVDYR